MRRFVPAFLLAFMAMVLAGCQTPVPALDFGPYCTDVTPTSAKVLWVVEPDPAVASSLTINQDAKIHIQAKPIYGQAQTLYVARITGMEPGSECQYKLTLARNDKLLNEINGTFQTAPLPGSTDPLRFVIYGDSRTYPDRHHAIAQAIAAEPHVAFIAISGDMCADGSRFALWKREFFDPGGDMLSHTVCWPGRGNHERDGVLFNMLFDMPRSYYSFDYGNVHFVEVDSDMAEIVPGELKSDKADPALLDWLEKDLAASQATWKIVEYHRPTFDSITHRTTWGQSDLLAILEKGGVDMVFNGHTHNYQRFRPIGVENKKPIVFVVSAGGGAPNYPLNPSPILEKAYSGIHYCVLDVHGNTLEMTAKLPDGSVLDQLKLVKNADGTFQKEVMDQAVTTTFARQSQFLLTGVYASSPTPPKAGEPFTMNVSPLQFPEGATVEIGTAVPKPLEPGEKPHGNWTVTPVTLTGWQGHIRDREESTEEELEPLTFTAVPPADFQMLPKGMSPSPRVSLRVTYQGQTYTNDNTGVFFYSANIKKWQAMEAPPKSWWSR